MFKVSEFRYIPSVKIFLVFLILILCGSANAQKNYYVSSQGDDSNPGTSESSAWKTIAKVNSMGFNPGDIVNFKSGEKFSDAMLDCKVGVTYTSWGSGKATIGDSLTRINNSSTIQINNEGVTLNNLKIYGYSYAAKVVAAAVGNWEISNCEIIGGQYSHESNVHGIETEGGITYPIIITHCFVHEFDVGIYLRTPYNVVIGYNTISDCYRWNGYQNSGGDCIRIQNTEGFDAEYTVNIHHNDISRWEHAAYGGGEIKRIILEYNYFHDNLDERLYLGGMKHGTVGKIFDMGDAVNGDAGIGKIFRYNYIYNIQRRGQPGYTYGRPTVENIKAGIPNVISSGGSDVYPTYVTSEGGTWSAVADAILSGLGYSNIWVHNNIFYKTTHQVFVRGYSVLNGTTFTFRTDLPSYFVNNTLIECGNSTITDDYGIIWTEVTSQSPHFTYNNIIDFNNSRGRVASRYKEEENYVDFNIYTSTRIGTTTSVPEYNSGIATWFQYSTNQASGDGEQYLKKDTITKIFAANIGPNGVYIPDLSIVGGGNTGKVYNTIGDTYTDSYSKHQLGEDPTGRSFAYDILGNLRTTNVIGALGSSSSSNNPGINVNTRIWLQGPFNNGSMLPLLSEGGYIPLNQSFSSAPWNYNGNESVSSVPTGVVDWVLLELRTGTAASTTVARKAVFLKSDGSVADLDGISKPSFGELSPGYFYIIIRHRNHLDIMSANPIPLSSNSSLYDFTTNPNKAYGNDPLSDSW